LTFCPRNARLSREPADFERRSARAEIGSGTDCELRK
jgi:hypothetical protein